MRTADCLRTGIIPACAGSTMLPAVLIGASRDHPRVRGEHRPLSLPSARASGSSPRARGAQHVRNRNPVREGIIPACAGSTRTGRRAQDQKGDHPRVRGEHDQEPWRDGWGTGSSPRARGARGRVRPGAGVVGIIPACAGSTRAFVLLAAGCRDHPRVRGEHPLDW